jgi:hypothetical protein
MSDDEANSADVNNNEPESNDDADDDRRPATKSHHSGRSPNADVDDHGDNVGCRRGSARNSSSSSSSNNSKLGDGNREQQGQAAWRRANRHGSTSGDGDNNVGEKTTPGSAVRSSGVGDEDSGARSTAAAAVGSLVDGEETSHLSSWARYLKNKYGSR